MGKHVAAYLRVSTSEQEVTRQIATVHSDAERLYPGLPVIEYPDEGVSGSDYSIFDRPESRKMLEAVKRGEIAAIVVDHIDRLSRQGSLDILKLKKLCDEHDTAIVAQGIVFGNDMASRIHLQILAEVTAEFSIELRRKILGGIDAAKEQGYWTNGSSVPFGYVRRGEKRRGVLIPTKDAAHVRRAFQMYADGKTSMRGTARWLSSVTGRNFNPNNFTRYFLTNVAFIGLIPNRDGEPFQGQHDPIISRPLWDAVQARVEAVDIPLLQVQPFGRILRCQCGQRLVFGRDSHSRSGGENTTLAYWRCAECRVTHVSEFVEASIVLALLATAWQLGKELEAPSFTVGSSPEDVATTEADIALLTEQHGRAVEVYTSLGDETARRLMGEYEERLTAHRNLLHRLGQTREQVRADWRKTYDRIRLFNVVECDPETYGLGVEDYFQLAWLDASLDQRKALLNDLLGEITVEKDSLLLHFHRGFQRPARWPLMTGTRHQRQISRELRALGLGAGVGSGEKVSHQV
jgi:DNA invertase Pin-like site-specific DNA recombinase